MKQNVNQGTDLRFRRAVEHSPSGLLMIDSEQHIVLVNKEVERIFGYSRDELLGKSFEILVPDRFRRAHTEFGREFWAAPTVRAMGAGRELYGRRKDGSEIPLEIGLNPITTDEGFFVLSSIVDISVRKRAEQRFRAAIEAAPSGMVMIDASGTILIVNRETERLFGYPREELLGRSIDILVPERFRSKHPEYRAGFFAHPSARLMGSGRDLYGLRKDGTEIPVEIGLNPVETDEGLLVLSAIIDISERKKAEEALRQAGEDLKRSNRELEQFAYVASHDLQEPLRMVVGFLNLLDERYKTQLDEKARAYIGHAVDSANRMSQLIENLLAYSRVDHRNTKLAPTDANKALAHALINLDHSIREASATVTHDELPTINGNPVQLSQLFQNLIGNAIKFRRDGVSPQIHIGCRRDDDRWLIYIRDNGIGIDPAYYEKVFLIFQRLHGRSEYPGTGIGLAICKKIVEYHGGRIWIESSKDEGSTFYCSFPKDAEKALAASVPND
jgi:PAS domain S-box-containing protein